MRRGSPPIHSSTILINNNKIIFAKLLFSRNDSMILIRIYASRLTYILNTEYAHLYGYTFRGIYLYNIPLYMYSLVTYSRPCAMCIAAEAPTKPLAEPDAVACRVEKCASSDYIRYGHCHPSTRIHTCCGEKGYPFIQVQYRIVLTVSRARGRSQRDDGLSSVHTSRAVAHDQPFHEKRRRVERVR